jgi:hypothetical protein
MELVRRDDTWLLPVAGEQVTRCCIDNAAVLLLCGNMIQISIGEPFMLNSSDGNSYSLDPSPSSNATALAPILRLMRRVI